MTEVVQPPPQNGIDLSAAEDDENNKTRPADIEQDMREMERRKRVEAIMGSKLFREELERIVDSARDGGTSGILQQLSDIVGLPASRVGSVYKASNCLMPINDIRGVESMGYAKGEKILRCKLAATFRLLDLYGWTQGLGAQITARLKVDQEYFLVNPYGLLYHEITASSLNKVDMQGNVVEQGTTNFGVNKSHFVLHSVVHAARPDIRCAIYIGCSPVVAVSSLKAGLLPITKDACVLGEVTTHPYSGALDSDERDRLIRNLGPNSKVMLLANHGALCCGETIEEAFYAATHIVQACETQLKLLPVGLDNLSLIPEESRKSIYEQARRPPEDLEKKFAIVSAGSGGEGGGSAPAEDTTDTTTTTTAAAPPKIGAAPKWRVGGAEFEALMRMLDNAGYRTGYIYRHPLIKSDPPKPKNDVELPPAVSSLGYLLEEEELFRQGIWKKGDLRKGGDRSRWLNSPNVYQKVEVLETGTPDPKKITKWVAEGSPTHSTPVRIEDPLQFVPSGTNPKEFKRLQQQIKDNRRADKISAGPQSHILEGVTWDEANRIRDATVSSTGDHVVLVGAASKGIIQRGFQHNATVYKAPYAKNPFDNVTDDELNEYKRTVERKKKSIHGEYTDTDFSESEALSSLPPTAQGKHGKTTGATQSEPEDMGAHQVMRIETQQAPVPSQPEVVLSDVNEQKSSNFQRTLLMSTHKHIIFNVHHHRHYHPQTMVHATQTELNNNSIANQKKFYHQQFLKQKYAFLFTDPSPSAAHRKTTTNYCNEKKKNFFLVYMIHKIEILPHYTYPFVNSSSSSNNKNKYKSQSLDFSVIFNDNAASSSSSMSKKNCKITELNSSSSSSSSSALSPALIAARSKLRPANLRKLLSSSEKSLLSTTIPPYRTVSHYGFNYPLTYTSSPNIKGGGQETLENEIEIQSPIIELQRQKVIAAFINSTNSFGGFASSSISKEHHPIAVNDHRGEQQQKDRNHHHHHPHPHPLKSIGSDHNDGSFVSVKEIHLTPTFRHQHQHQHHYHGHQRRQRFNSKASTMNALSTTTEEHDLSEELSVVSFDGGTCTYPPTATTTTTTTHSQHSGEQEHDVEADISGDNYSSSTADISRRHQPYVLRNFDTLTGRNLSTLSFERDLLQHHHKPEAEQAESESFHQRNGTTMPSMPPPPPPPLPPQPVAASTPQSIPSQRHHNPYVKQKQIKLTVNSLQQGYTPKSSKKNNGIVANNTNNVTNEESSAQLRNPNDSLITAAEAAVGTTPSDDRDVLNTIEVHINVAIKHGGGSGGAGNNIDTNENHVHTSTSTPYEEDIRLKLEKVISDEINIITQQLAAAAAAANHCYDQAHQQYSRMTQNNIIEQQHQQQEQHANSSDGDESFGGNASDSGIHASNVAMDVMMDSVSTVSGNMDRRCHETLILLEHELKSLLDCIIRANELHNRNIICDCKTKISRISDDVRATLSGGGAVAVAVAGAGAGVQQQYAEK